MRAHARTHACTRTHKHTPARAHAITHTHIHARARTHIHHTLDVINVINFLLVYNWRSWRFSYDYTIHRSNLSSHRSIDIIIQIFIFSVLVLLIFSVLVLLIFSVLVLLIFSVLFLFS